MLYVIKFIEIVFALILLNTVFFGQQNLRLDEIEKTYINKRQYAEAIDSYKKLLDETRDVPTRVDILFRLGTILRLTGQYDESIESFKQILLVKVDKNDPVQFRSNYVQAQWEIGNSYFGKGDFEEALSAYRSPVVKDLFINKDCGVRDFHREIVEGMTLERLGRVNEAIPLYLKADEIHLAEMYFKAGQLDDLREIVNSINEPVIADRMRKYAWTRAKASEDLPLYNLNAAIELFDQEKAENWPELIKAAYHYMNLREYGRNNIAILALARHIDKVLQLLKAEPGKATIGTQVGVIYEILAASQNEDAIMFLKAQVGTYGLHWDNALTLIRTLNLAGDKGQRLLDELEVLDKTKNLKSARMLYGENDDLDKFGRFEVKFPVIGQLPKLPNSGAIEAARKAAQRLVEDADRTAVGT